MRGQICDSAQISHDGRQSFQKRISLVPTLGRSEGVFVALPSLRKLSRSTMGKPRWLLEPLPEMREKCRVYRKDTRRVWTELASPSPDFLMKPLLAAKKRNGKKVALICV
jgi:hypothetical protein